jgi:hypothetical protein
MKHTRLGYDVLVKRKVDELLEREDRSADMAAPHGDPDPTHVGGDSPPSPAAPGAAREGCALGRATIEADRHSFME